MTNIFFKLEERIAMAFFAATSIFVLIGAATRTAGVPVIWAVDLAQLSFAWACVLGADLALKKNTHIEIDILTRKFPRSVRKVLAIIWLIAIAFFLCFLVWYGSKLTLQNMERVLGDVGISYSWVTACIPVGSFLMLVTAVTRLWRGLTGREVLSLEGHDGTAI